jgi:hypothetical protein
MQKLSPSWQDLSGEQWQEACRRVLKAPAKLACTVRLKALD